MDTLVKYETAKLIKERGIGIETPLVYSKFNEFGLGDGEKIHVRRDVCKRSDIPAPTQSLFRKLLREKYQIFIEILTDQTCEPKFVFKINIFYGNPRDLAEREWGWKKHTDFEFFLYRTFEEALDEAILESLKLI